jgi:hypothetical protein
LVDSASFLSKWEPVLEDSNPWGVSMLHLANFNPVLSQALSLKMDRVLTKYMNWVYKVFVRSIVETSVRRTVSSWTYSASYLSLPEKERKSVGRLEKCFFSPIYHNFFGIVKPTRRRNTCTYITLYVHTRPPYSYKM